MSTRSKYRLVGDKSDDEIELERLGDINDLQRYRLAQYYDELRRNCGDVDNDKNGLLYGDALTANRLYLIEEELREAVQGEASLRLSSSLRLNSSNIDAHELNQQLASWNKKYRVLAQKWWWCYSSLMEGTQRRGFDLWRSNPKWYMHRALIEDWAGKGGCCARGCGCCSRREPTPTRPLGVGHCTFECACCQKDQGFKLDMGERKALKEEYRASVLNLSRHRIVRVSMWGLVGDVETSPFDMIVDEPPSYSQAQASSSHSEGSLI